MKWCRSAPPWACRCSWRSRRRPPLRCDSGSGPVFRSSPSRAPTSPWSTRIRTGSGISHEIQMNIDLLIKMANAIGDFFSGVEVNDPDAAARDVANHIRRYGEPRLRAQILKSYEERDGAGLPARARSAVELLDGASKGRPAAAGTAATATA